MAAPDFGGLLGRAKVAGQGMSTPKVPALEDVEDVEPVEGGEDPMITRLQPIAQDFINAVKSGDSSALAEAWIAGQSAIKAGPSEAESEEYGEE